MGAIANQTIKERSIGILRRWLQRDGWVIILYVLTTVVMTYPIIFHMDGTWIASSDEDTFMKLWDVWWFNRAIGSGTALNVTPVLFFPAGLDLTFHSISWTVSAFIWVLTPLFGTLGAYHFSILLAIFGTAYGGYLLLSMMVDHKSAAWLGGAIYSFIPYHIAHSGAHPDLVHLGMIPIAALLLYRAYANYSWKLALGAAAMLGLAAFTSLYIMVFALITIAPILIFLMVENQRWRTAKFWKTSLVFGLVGGAAVGLRVMPLFQSTTALSSAIDQKFDADWYQTDVVSFVTPSKFNPVFAPFVTRISAHFRINRKWPAYLGVVPLGLTLLAITWKKRRKFAWLWFSIGLIFLFLSLGPALRMYGELYDNIPLPAAWLTWFPPIRAVRPDFFVLGLALPLAVCAGIGLDRALFALERHPRAKVILAVGMCSLLLFEYWNGPFPGVDAAVSPFYGQLADDPATAAVIDLPMGRQVSKWYLYYQTIHQQPIVEGLSGRTPADAYTYIKANPLLAQLRKANPLDCQKFSAAEFNQSLDRLTADGFKYIIVHQQLADPQPFAGYLTSTPVYHDRSITVYSIADLQASPPCLAAP